MVMSSSQCIHIDCHKFIQKLKSRSNTQTRKYFELSFVKVIIKKCPLIKQQNLK